MVRLAVVGCTGKLGSAIMKNALHREDVEIRYAIARRGNSFVGQRISELMEGGFDLPIINDIEAAKDCDVFIDCTNAETFMKDSYLKYERMGKALVIATTGFSCEAIENIGRLAAAMPVFLSGNFSVALHDFTEVLKAYGKRISPDTDIQIIEYHHNQKKDAPSGTALALADAINGAFDNNYQYKYDRTKERKKREKNEIGIQAVRGGSIVGEHEVIFAGTDEVIEIKHTAYSKAVFGKGAVEAAKFLVGKPAGKYDMKDVLKNKWSHQKQMIIYMGCLNFRIFL